MVRISVILDRRYRLKDDFHALKIRVYVRKAMFISLGIEPFTPSIPNSYWTLICFAISSMFKSLVSNFCASDQTFA